MNEVKQTGVKSVNTTITTKTNSEGNKYKVTVVTGITTEEEYYSIYPEGSVRRMCNRGDAEWMLWDERWKSVKSVKGKITRDENMYHSGVSEYAIIEWHEQGHPKHSISLYLKNKDEVL